MADHVSDHRGVMLASCRFGRRAVGGRGHVSGGLALCCVVAHLVLASNAWAQALGRAPGAVQAGAGPTGLSQWQRDLRLDLSLVISDNALLRRRGAELSDVAFRTAPSIGLRRESGRFRFDGRYSPVILGYANDSRQETLFNVLGASSSFEAVEGRAFIDGKATISQVFLSPFETQPTEVSTASFNRTEARTLSLSPYVRGPWGQGGRYELRSDNSYSTFTAQSTLSITTTGVSGEVAGARGNLVALSANGYYSQSTYGSGLGVTTQSGSARATLNAEPDFVPYLTGGYESNEFFLATFQGPRYGGGFKWQPSPRTSVDVGVEKRYFGTSFNFDATHRTRLSLWSLRVYRTDRVTPVGGGLGVGAGAPVSTRDFLSNLLRTQYTDEAQRQIEVDRLMASGFLPTTLSAQSALSSPRVLLVEGVEPSLAITGVRNTVLSSVFWRRTTPLSSNGGINFTDVFNTVNGFEQIGGSVTWTHRFDGQTSASAGVDRFNTKSIRSSPTQPASVETEQTIFRFFLTREVGPQTTANAGIRFTRFASESSNSTPLESRERALQFGVLHRFF